VAIVFTLRGHSRDTFDGASRTRRLISSYDADTMPNGAATAPPLLVSRVAAAPGGMGTSAQARIKSEALYVRSSSTGASTANRESRCRLALRSIWSAIPPFMRPRCSGEVWVSKRRETASARSRAGSNLYPLFSTLIMMILASSSIEKLGNVNTWNTRDAGTKW